MKQTFYQFILYCSKLLGSWVFHLFARFIAAGYFLLFPGRVRNSLDFYRSLFPNRSKLAYLYDTWRQYQSFTNVFLDRFLVLNSNKISHTSSGWHHLEKVLAKGQGGIILMSHMGNWELAAHRLIEQNRNLKLLLYLGSKHKEQIEKLQKQSLKESGIKIIAVEQKGGSPFQLLESLKWMNEGGLVSLTGDRVWTENQKTITVDFLGQKARLPETPFMLALLSGKPLFTLFSFPVNKNEYRMEISEPIYVSAQNRNERKTAVKNSAQTYARQLEAAARRAPFQWFHFEPFLIADTKNRT